MKKSVKKLTKIDMKGKITQEQKWQEIENLERQKIRVYWQFEKLKEEAQKGNETISVLVRLLEKEINTHNGILERKIKKIRNTGTID